MFCLGALILAVPICVVPCMGANSLGLLAHTATPVWSWTLHAILFQILVGPALVLVAVLTFLAYCCLYL